MINWVYLHNYAQHFTISKAFTDPLTSMSSERFHFLWTFMTKSSAQMLKNIPSPDTCPKVKSSAGYDSKHDVISK